MVFTCVLLERIFVARRKNPCKQPDLNKRKNHKRKTDGFEILSNIKL